MLGALAKARVAPARLAGRVHECADADDTAVIQHLSCWTRDKELGDLCVDHGKLLPIRRLFEPQWEHRLGKGATRIERLSAHATETGTRLNLPNDYLFKVDTASMSQSLEVRVPMLDEDLFAFGLSIPHRVNVNGHSCKLVLRSVAHRRLPTAVSQKAKAGFAIPIDSWVDDEFRTRLAQTLLGPSSRLPEFFRPKVYRPIVQSFCNRVPFPNVSRQGLYQRIIMLLALHSALDSHPA